MTAEQPYPALPLMQLLEKLNGPALVEELLETPQAIASFQGALDDAIEKRALAKVDRTEAIAAIKARALDEVVRQPKELAADIEARREAWVLKETKEILEAAAEDDASVARCEWELREVRDRFAALQAALRYRTATIEFLAAYAPHTTK